MANQAKAEGGGGMLYADSRYAIGSETAFMSPFYKQNKLAVDVGVAKNTYSNEVFTTFVRRVLSECKEQNIPIRMHTGKFYVYDPTFTHWMYDEEARGRFTDVIEELDPFHMFAPEHWRDLFTIKE